MAENLINAGLAKKISELRRADALERERSLRAAEAAVPRTEDLISIGPVPEEYTPVPGPASLGPGGMGPRVQIDPRFGGYPGIGSTQMLTMTDPRGDPERERDVRMGYANPASVDAYYPAVQDAYLRQRGARAGHVATSPRPAWEDSAWNRLHGEYMDVRDQAWDYADPETAAFRERRRLLEEARAQEAAKQMALEQMFGTPQERAEDIISLEALQRAR